MALWDEEAEFYPLCAQLEGESSRGHDGLERFFGLMAEDWEDVRFELAGEPAASTSTSRLEY